MVSFQVLCLVLIISAASAQISPSCALNGLPCPTPVWPVEWNLTRSTICQPGTVSGGGYFIPPASEPWGLVSLDWSVAENLWLANNTRNSTCEATSQQGCKLLKEAGLATRCFIYHNTELALEWLESQREVMYNESTANYFLQYTDKYGNNNGTIYNERRLEGDQYFWDFRNPDAAAYFVSSIVESVSGPYVDGTFLDDVTGLPMEHPNVTQYLNMSSTQVNRLQYATQATNQWLIDALVKQGKYSWQAFGAGDGVVWGPNYTNCYPWMRQYCQPAYQGYPLALRMESDPSNRTQTVAAFLVVRPPYGWLGWGWESGVKQWDPIFLMNVGEPVGLCEEGPPGVFSRPWTQGTAVLDCNTWTPTLPFQS